MERGWVMGGARGDGSVMGEEFGECGHSVEAKELGDSGLRFGGRGVHPVDAGTHPSMCPRVPSLGLVSQGSWGLSRAPTRLTGLGTLLWGRRRGNLRYGVAGTRTQ